MMMIDANLLNTVDQVMAWAKRNEAISKLAEALREIGSLDQAARETEARLEQAHAAESAIRGRLEQAHGGIAKSEQEAAEILRQATASATEILAVAIEDAARHKAQAAEQAKQHTDKARELEVASQARVDAAMREHAGAVARLKDEAKTLVVEIQDKNRELEDITRKVEAAKAEVARMLR